MVKCTGRGLVVKRPGVLSKLVKSRYAESCLGGGGSFPFLQILANRLANRPFFLGWGGGFGLPEPLLTEESLKLFPHFGVVFGILKEWRLRGGGEFLQWEWGDSSAEKASLGSARTVLSAPNFYNKNIQNGTIIPNLSHYRMNFGHVISFVDFRAKHSAIQWICTCKNVIWGLVNNGPTSSSQTRGRFTYHPQTGL